jgi:MFS family permease
METEKSATRVQREFVLLLTVTFLTTFGSSMVSASPVPFLLKELAGPKTTFEELIGVVASVSSVAMITGNFAGGFLADRVGRKSVVVLGSGALIPSLLAYALVPNAAWVVALYFVQSFSLSLFQPALMALVADVSRTSSRGMAFGYFYLFAIGSGVPAFTLGGYLADSVSLRFPFMVAALVELVGLLASLGLSGISIRATFTNGRIGQVEDEPAPMPFTSVLAVFGTLGLLSGVASGMLTPLNRLYPIEVLHVDATELGLIFSIGSALVTALVQIPGGRLTDKFGRKPLTLFSLLGAPFVVALAFTNSLFAFILVTAGLVAFGNIGAPAYSAWLMELVSSPRRASAQGLINAITGVGMFFAPFISVWLYLSQPNVAVAFAWAAFPWALQIPPILILKETKN